MCVFVLMLQTECALITVNILCILLYSPAIAADACIDRFVRSDSYYPGTISCKCQVHYITYSARGWVITYLLHGFF